MSCPLLLRLVPEVKWRDSNQGLVAANRQKALRAVLRMGGGLVAVVALPSRLSDPIIARNLWDSWSTSAKRKGLIESISIAVRKSCKSQCGGLHAHPGHVTSSFAVDLRNDSQKLTAYVQVSALSTCLVNLSEVGSHVYHPIILFSVAFSQLLVQAKKQMKKRNKLVTLALHPGQEK